MLERIYVEIGNICNLDCSFCQKTTRKNRQMSEEEFAEVCRKIKGHTKFIYLHVMGEPLLHPSLDAMLKIAGSEGLPVCITTNGTLLYGRGDIILDNFESVHKVSISLHAPEGNGITDYDDYLKSACDFAKAASERGIYVVFRLWNGDSDEGLGKNSQNGRIESCLHSFFGGEWQKRVRGYRIAKNTFLEYDGVFAWPSSSKAEDKDEGFCHALSNQAAILADGTVVPCCLDSNGEITLGNIFESDFADIMSYDRATAMKNGFKNGKMVESLCKKCTFARKFKIR